MSTVVSYYQRSRDIRIVTADQAGNPPGREGLGRALRRAAAGYRRQVAEELAAAGYTDWHPPDGRVLLLCASAEPATISDIGRRLNITRQGASKIVAGLRDRGYLTVSPSPADGREKVLALTSRAAGFLDAHVRAAAKIEERLCARLGEDAAEQLFRFLEVVAGSETAGPEEILPLRSIRWRDQLQ
jgi:DNA-binding MarR family transcriptional regulator